MSLLQRTRLYYSGLAFQYATLETGESKQKQKYDVIIRNGTVYDGSGQPGLKADVGINADTVAFIGDLKEAQGTQEVDASGLAVAPGFINMLSHTYEALLFDGNSQGDIRQGVTLEVFGPTRYLESYTWPDTKKGHISNQISG